MKKPNITEGKWEVRDTCFGLMVCMKDKDIAIADCATAHIGKEEWENNLQAISAVPDMIGVLMQVHETLHECLEYVHGVGEKYVREDIEKIEQALTKAGVNLNEAGGNDE